jgi:hypothetical protein
MSDIMKFRPVGEELYHMEGRTDMTRILETFSSFENEPKDELEWMWKEAFVA